MSTAATKPTKVVPQKSGPMTGMVLLIVLAVIAFVLLIFYKVFGIVSGEEFSPEKLEYRYFIYYEVPFFRTQISPIQYDKREMPTFDALLTEAYFPKPLPGEGRWDLVYGKRGWGRTEGDANILLDYLNARNDRGEKIWEVWSLDNPPLAAVFWPEVIKTIRSEEYVKLPDLFDKARQSTTPEELAAKLGVPVPANLPPPKTAVPAPGTTPAGGTTPAAGTPAAAAPAVTPAADSKEKSPKGNSGDKEQPTAQEPLVPASN